MLTSVPTIGVNSVLGSDSIALISEVMRRWFQVAGRSTAVYMKPEVSSCDVRTMSSPSEVAPIESV